MSEYFKYEALAIPDKPATEVLKSKGLDLDFTPKQYQYIPELNTGDFHINGLNLDGYFSINKAKEPVQYKHTQLNTPSKNKKILEQPLDKYGYFSINKAKEPVQYKHTQLKLNHNTPSKNKKILEQTLDNSINKAKEPVQYKHTQLKLNHNTPSKNKKILEQTLDKYGITGNKKTTLMKIASLESGFNSKAQSKNSSAAGWFQFIDSTRNKYSKLSREQFKNSPDAQVLVASQLYDDNARFLRNNGIAVTGEAIAASWLNPKWTKNYYKYGIAGGADANGTSIAKYINKFRNA